MSSQDYHTLNLSILGVMVTICLLFPPVIMYLQLPWPCLPGESLHDCQIVSSELGLHWNAPCTAFFALMLAEILWRGILAFSNYPRTFIKWDLLIHLPVTLWSAYLWFTMIL